MAKFQVLLTMIWEAMARISVVLSFFAFRSSKLAASKSARIVWRRSFSLTHRAYNTFAQEIPPKRPTPFGQTAFVLRMLFSLIHHAWKEIFRRPSGRRLAFFRFADSHVSSASIRALYRSSRIIRRHKHVRERLLPPDDLFKDGNVLGIFLPRDMFSTLPLPSR